jgi:hypothetical protein
VSDDLRVDMRRLSPRQQETLRKRVIAAIRDGMPDVEARRVFGVSRNLICNLKARYEAGGTAGLASDRPGRRGQAPVVARTGNRFSLNAMSTRGQLHFTVFRSTFNAAIFIDFLDKLLGQLDQKLCQPDRNSQVRDLLPGLGASLLGSRSSLVQAFQDAPGCSGTGHSSL